MRPHPPDALLELAAEVPLSEVTAVGITCQRESFALLEENDAPVRPAVLWADTRSTPQVEKYGNERHLKISDKTPSTVQALYKLIWLKENEPEMLRRAKTLVDVGGYIAHELTGEWVTNLGTVDPLGLVNLAAGTYEPELIELAGVSIDTLLRFVNPGEIMGTVSAEAATRTGLKKGTPVVASVGDGQAAGLGANVADPSFAYLSLGTAVGFGTPAENYAYDRAYRTMVGYRPGTYILESVISSACYLISWFINNFGVEGVAKLGLRAEHLLETTAARVPVGSDGLLCLPYHNGAMTPYWDGTARGAFIGLRGSHGMAEMYRAILEGVAYEIRVLAEAINQARNCDIEQIIANATGLPMSRCSATEVTALGAAIHAAAAVGFCGSNDLMETAGAMTRTDRKWIPDPASAKVYDRFYPAYQAIYPSLVGIYRDLDEAMRVVDNG